MNFGYQSVSIRECILHFSPGVEQSSQAGYPRWAPSTRISPIWTPDIQFKLLQRWNEQHHHLSTSNTRTTRSVPHVSLKQKTGPGSRRILLHAKPICYPPRNVVLLKPSQYESLVLSLFPLRYFLRHVTLRCQFQGESSRKFWLGVVQIRF